MIDWRDTLARAIRESANATDKLLSDNCSEDMADAAAQGVIAVIAAAGYRLHRDHDWAATEGQPFDPVITMTCRRCGALSPGLSDHASCEGPA